MYYTCMVFHLYFVWMMIMMSVITMMTTKIKNDGNEFFFFILHVSSLCRLGKHFMADSPPIRTSMSVCVFLHVTFLMKPFATVLEWANKRTISTVNNWNPLHKSNRSVETSIFICTTCVSSCVYPASMPV